MSPLVLGAGVAGLAAAVELARAGLQPRVIEARPFVGGRTRSFTHFGDEIDNGQHLLMGCYRETLRLLELIGTRHLVAIQPRLRVDFRDADGTADVLAAPSLPPPLDVLVGLMRLRGLSLSERAGLLRVAREAMRTAIATPLEGTTADARETMRTASQEPEHAQMRATDVTAAARAASTSERIATEADERARGTTAARPATPTRATDGGRSVHAGTGHAPDDETVSQMLARLRQSARACERLWHPIVLATLNTAPEYASAALFIEVLRRAFLGTGQDSRLAMPRAGLSSLLSPAVDYITARGGSVELGVSATRVERDPSGLVVHVKDGEPLRSAHVVCALPPRSASTLLERLVPGLGAGIELSPIVSMYLWFDRPLGDIPEMTALIGTSVQWVFNRRRMMPDGSATAHGLLSCTISAAVAEAAESSDAVIERADAELRRAFPELRDAALVNAVVLKEKHATFRAVPGLERPATRTDIPGLYLAGDWTATGLPATIEGAVQSGFAAAEALVAASQLHGLPR